MKEKIDNYCIDCKKWTRQTYHHTNNVDGDLVYICNECGCENSIYVEYLCMHNRMMFGD